MKKMMKKIFSSLMIVAMVLSFFPAGAFAGDSIDASNMPAKYRSDDPNGDGNKSDSYVPLKLRDQGDYGTCWAYSAMAACETDMIKDGLADARTVDYSEGHLAYFAFNKGATLVDPLDNMTGDYTELNSDLHYLDYGAVSNNIMWQLVSWAGPVSESSNSLFREKSFQDNKDLQLDDSMMFNNAAAHVQNVFLLDINDRNTLKKNVKKYGSITMAYYSNDKYGNGIEETTNGATPNDEGAYYCPKKRSSDHIVQIIGWDDNYSKKKFNSNAQPTANGAWLCRNSWGKETKDYAEDGLFWISYYDKSIDEYMAYDCEVADNYDNNYQYDGSYSDWVGDAASAANVFTAKANGDLGESLKAVGIGTDDDNVKYTLKIYTYNDTFKKITPSNIKNGTIAITQKGTLRYAGYNTVKLNKPVLLEAGQKFAVMFDFGQRDVQVYIDGEGDDEDVRFITVQERNQSFLRWKDSSSFEDAYDFFDDGHYTARIKAYTVNDDVNSEMKRTQGAKITSFKAKASKGKVVLSWSKSPSFKVDGYYIYKSTKKDSNYALIGKTESLKLINNKNLKKGKTYYFKIKGYQSINGEEVCTKDKAIKVIAK